MFQTWKIGVIAVGAFVVVVATFTTVVIMALKAHHNRLMAKFQDEERRLRREGHHRRGSLGGAVEPQSRVSQLPASLRRSIHMPYGIVPHGWAAISSRESLSNQTSGTSTVPTSEPPRSKLKRDRSRHSLTLPRSVRPRKGKKAIALVNLQQRSPLSAITERSQTNSVASPDLNVIAEMPIHITPKTTPEKDEKSDGQNENKAPKIAMGRPASTAWPLPRPQWMSVLQQGTRATSVPSELPVPEVVEPLAERPPLGQRNASIISQESGIAPEQPVPPLPSNTSGLRYPHRRTSKLRISTASIDTANSSILEDAPASSQSDTDLTSVSLFSPLSNSNAGRHADSEVWDHSSFTRLGSPPGRQTMRSLRMKQMSHGSFRGVIGQDPLQRMGSTGQGHDTRNDQDPTQARRSASFLQVPTEGHQRPPIRHGSLRSPPRLTVLGPSPLGDLLRHSSAGPTGPRQQAQRHSMFEGCGSQSQDTDALRSVSGNNMIPLRSQKRPASVSAPRPFQWDQATLQPARPATMIDGNGRKGHKRQNCIRISNLPPITIGSAPNTFPPTVEESEESSYSPLKPKIPGLTLLESASRSKVPSIPTFNPQLSNLSSPDRLQSNSLYQHPLISRIPSSANSSIPHRQSGEDIFSSRPGSRLSSHFQLYDTTQWPFGGPRISPEETLFRNTTHRPPSLTSRKEPSPTSPSQFHFSRPLHPQQSPRSQSHASPSSTLRFGRGTNTPTHSPRGSPSSRPQSHASSRLQKSRPRSKATTNTAGKELHRSVLLLRRMNSDANSSQSVSPRTSNLYLDMGGSGFHTPLGSTGISPSMLRLKSPSLLSMGSGSVWEDASMSDYPVSPCTEKSPSFNPMKGKSAGNGKSNDLHNGSGGMGTEVWKNNTRIVSANNPFATPKGKGLGLMPWGTPGSLYDKEGFLKL
jgi:hypothetical protein